MVGVRLRSSFSPPDIRQFARFAIVGCSNVAVSFIIFYICYTELRLASLIINSLGVWGHRLQELLTQFGISTVDAGCSNIVAYAGGMINSFCLNKTWTFDVRGRTLTQMRRFVVVNIVGLTISTSIMFVLVDLRGMPYLITWFLTIGFVMFLSFLGSKYWAFAEQTSHGK
jgi:putative flippase GtrA